LRSFASSLPTKSVVSPLVPSMAASGSTSAINEAVAAICPD
jgi:hypothetical protein